MCVCGVFFQPEGLIFSIFIVRSAKETFNVYLYKQIQILLPNTEFLQLIFMRKHVMKMVSLTNIFYFWFWQKRNNIPTKFIFCPRLGKKEVKKIHSEEEEFEDPKGAIRIRISKKNRQHNSQKKKYKRTTIYKTYI